MAIMPVTNTSEESKPKTKYGPLTIHQSGVLVEHLSATPTPVVAAKSRVAHSLENVRLSLHLERFDSQEDFSVNLTCVMRFPEYGYELKHSAPCEMRIGRLHGAAVVPATCICVDFESPHDTVMEIEYSLADESLAKMSVPVRFPPKVEA